LKAAVIVAVGARGFYHSSVSESLHVGEIWNPDRYCLFLATRSRGQISGPILHPILSSGLEFFSFIFERPGGSWHF